MTLEIIGIGGILALFALLSLRMPVGLSMLVVGFFGTVLAGGQRLVLAGMDAERAFSRSWGTAFSNLTGETMEAASNYNLIVIPMFVLMGNFAGISGMSKDLFTAAQRWIGHFKGGLASSTVVACAMFAALSGSSLASAVTMGRVALPEMKRYKYGNSLATGSVAAGGTLGFLIPPSGGMIIYAVLTEQSIGRLFMAGVIPGIMLTGLFLLAVRYFIFRRPEQAPAGNKSSMTERLQALWRAIPILGVILLTIIGMYTGFFTPVEASAVGAFLTFLVAVARKQINLASLAVVISQTVGATATIFLILIGAFVFIPFMSLTELPSQLVIFLTTLPIGDIGILLVVIAIYIFLGTFLEGIAMMVLTLPVIMPIAASLGWDLVWFGIIIMIVLEMGMISPPVGLNVFIVKSIAPEVPMREIFAGIWPFWFAMAFMVALLVIFPQIALYLPQTMIGM